MWARPDKPVPLHPSQLKVGLYIWLDLPWDAHPFLYNKFRIAKEEQIKDIRALGLSVVHYFPNKSNAEPGPVIETPEAPPPPQTADTGAPDPLAVQKESKSQLLRKQKELAARVERGWEKAAASTREALIGLNRNPRQAGEAIAALSRETATMISQGSEVLLHLLGDKNGEGPQFHALNVMTLSMILGKAVNLPETELADLAMGALAHDAGKARIPAHLLKTANRAKHEEEFYRAHGQYGVEMAKEAGVFSETAISVIRDHHVLLDGSGWPAGSSNPGLPARIVALVNRYDRLCCPESPDKPALMPAEALAVLYAREGKKFDAKLLGLMIKILGVYPPGTIAQLNDGALGLVVSPGRESLRPKVLVYDPDVPKEEAPVIDLAAAEDLKIEESLKPSSLPADVLAWLNPRQRLSYFFSVESALA